ncbi:MAG: hypothetical protein WBF88_17430 [Pusillimonas sp.]
MQIDPELRSFATPRQLEYLDAVEKHGSNQKAAAALGLNRRTVDEGIALLRKNAALRGYAPEFDMTRTVPSTHVAKGISTYYNKDGKVTAQWVKSSLADDQLQAIRQAAFDAMAEELPREPAAPFSGGPCNGDLLNCYVITDFHLGALSWAPETGASWDIDIAETTLVAWFARAIEQSPNAKTALLAQISDLLHWDGFDAVTPASKHLLDADGRFPKLVRVAIRVLRRIIRMLLAKHEQLHIIMADANHDPVSQVWLREWLSVLYEDDPRITVDTSPSPYNAYEFGKVAIFTHHGHKRKVTNVAEVFAAQFREMFGRTKYAYAHMGHLHHTDVKENNLMIVEQHRTLAAPDAYAARGGWLAGRDAKVITYHKSYGEVGRITVSYDMIKEAA